MPESSAVPALSALPPGVVTLDDHERAAQARLDAATWAYVHGGAGDEITVGRNRQAWQARSLVPRVLRDLTGGHTRTTLLGRTLAHPILIAPTAFHRLVHPDGELATAYAAAAQGAGLVLSAQATVTLESVATAIGADATRGPLWFQLYWQRERDAVRQLVARAEAAGYEAIVLTVDASSSGARDRERRAGFQLPPGITAVNLKPAPTTSAPTPGDSGLFTRLPEGAPTWCDIAWLRSITRLPIVLKGILHEADARQAVHEGVAAIIVSNHGGRTLDTTPATATVLPRLADAVGGAVPLLVDGGIRRGTDVAKALALGASAVLIGRPVIYGLANAGAIGVAHVLRLLRDEFEIAMALCGCRTVADLSADVLLQA